MEVAEVVMQTELRWDSPCTLSQRRCIGGRMVEEERGERSLT